MFGFDLMRNFNYPYFSRNIAEFWRRWHISLSTWFRDYVYIPLGGSRGTRMYQLRNVLIIFLVSGFWHGANWTFVVWGGLHALFFIPVLLTNTNRNHLDQVAGNRLLPSLREVFQMIFTFGMVLVAWVFFRAESVYLALSYIKRMLVNLQFSIEYLSIGRYSVEFLLMIIVFIGIEWFHRQYEHPFIGRFKWIKIAVIIILLLTLGVYSDQQDFIYFQF